MNRLLSNRHLKRIDDPTTPGAGTPPAPTDPRAAENADKKFSQAEVTAFLTREKDQGERAGKSAVATALNEKLAAAGFADSDFDAVIALAAAAKTADDEKKTEAERQRDDALAKATAAEQSLATARAELRNTRITAALTAAGASNAAVAARAVVVAADADAAAIATAVAALKTEAPGLFGTTSTPQAPGSDPGTPPANPSATQGAAELGKAEAARRFPAKAA